jgi:hypothetical protein
MPRTVTAPGRRQAWSDEMSRARTAGDRGDSPGEWHHLERAHILSQPMAVPHVQTHVASRMMFNFDVSRPPS